MAIWQWGLLALFCVWALQSLGVWLQMRHYTDVFKGVTNQFNDGFVGAGNFRGRFSKGTIVVISLWEDEKAMQASEDEATRVREEATAPGETSSVEHYEVAMLEVEQAG